MLPFNSLKRFNALDVLLPLITLRTTFTQKCLLQEYKFLNKCICLQARLRSCASFAPITNLFYTTSKVVIYFIKHLSVRLQGNENEILIEHSFRWSLEKNYREVIIHVKKCFKAIRLTGDYWSLSEYLYTSSRSNLAAAPEYPRYSYESRLRHFSATVGKTLQKMTYYQKIRQKGRPISIEVATMFFNEPPEQGSNALRYAKFTIEQVA